MFNQFLMPPGIANKRKDVKRKTDSINPTVVQIIKDLVSFYRDREKKLIYLHYKKGTTQQEIGTELGVTRQAINFLYPKGEK